MRILVLGAGAVGAYFGARLLQAGRDVTFLVRAARAHRLAQTGLCIQSRFGDAQLAAPPVLVAGQLPGPSGPPFDLAILACKAYDLDAAMETIAPVLGDSTLILPLLNGVRHMQELDRRFGPQRVLGGLCAIGATLDAQGRVLHLNDLHVLTFGERDGRRSERGLQTLELLSGALFDARLSERINQEMWEKWVFLAALAASTCLMRAPIGAIVRSAGGSAFILDLLQECCQVARAVGLAPREHFIERTRAVLTAPDSLQSASMLRDIERLAPIESEQIIGDLLRRADSAPQAGPLPLLKLAYTQLKAYEAQLSARQALAVR